MNGLNKLLENKNVDLENIFIYINILNNIEKNIENNNIKLLIKEIKNKLLIQKEENNLNNNENKNFDEIINKKINVINNIQNKFNKFFEIKKFSNDLYLNPYSSKFNKISYETIQNYFKFLNNEFIISNNNNFYSLLLIKLTVNFFLSLKSNKNLSNFYLKIFKENLFNFLNKSNILININISEKYFEILVKIIKKLKSKTFLISLNILKILFEIFENKNIINKNKFIIVSSISIVAYLIEYSKNEIINYYDTIILTGINYLKSKSSSVEEKRASAFLLYKILSKFNTEEIKNFEEKIFNAIKIEYENSNDNVLTFHLMNCLKFYE